MSKETFPAEQILANTNEINALTNYLSGLTPLIIDKHAPISRMLISHEHCS